MVFFENSKLLVAIVSFFHIQQFINATKEKLSEVSQDERALRERTVEYMPSKML